MKLRVDVLLLFELAHLGSRIQPGFLSSSPGMLTPRDVKSEKILVDDERELVLVMSKKFFDDARPSGCCAREIL